MLDLLRRVEAVIAPLLSGSPRARCGVELDDLGMTLTEAPGRAPGVLKILSLEGTSQGSAGGGAYGRFAVMPWLPDWTRQRAELERFFIHIPPGTRSDAAAALLAREIAKRTPFDAQASCANVEILEVRRTRLGQGAPRESRRPAPGQPALACVSTVDWVERLGCFRSAGPRRRVSSAEA